MIYPVKCLHSSKLEPERNFRFDGLVDALARRAIGGCGIETLERSVEVRVEIQQVQTKVVQYIGVSEKIVCECAYEL